MIRLIAFLGNTGAEYANTRHNVGWMVADELPLARYASWMKKFRGEYAGEQRDGEKRHLLKPLTLMNRSGDSVLAAMQFFKLKPEELLVVHDELELELGALTLKRGGGLRSHNGLRSIAGVLSSKEFYRLQVGIGRPKRGDVFAYVLSAFSKDERIVLPMVLEKAASMIEGCLRDGVKDLKAFNKVRVFS